MNLHLEKPWIEFTPERVRTLPGQMGVFQLGDGAGSVVFIGFAGGKSLFGLRSELEKRMGAAPKFRYEVNNQYQTRWRELLMLHEADHGAVPALNQREGLPNLGKLG